jgi:hypothetical protein
MTMITHTHNPNLLHRDASVAQQWDTASHVAIIKRFAKVTLSIVLIAIVVTAVMAIRVVAWFPPFHH